jgi:hypothetical protein
MVYSQIWLNLPIDDPHFGRGFFSTLWSGWTSIFVGQICEVFGLAIMHTRNLAKFDYPLHKTIEKLKFYTIVWQHATT